MNEFLRNRLVCPVSKASMTLKKGMFCAPCGFKYPENDFRVGLEFSQDWHTEPLEYEAVEKQWLKGLVKRAASNSPVLLDLMELVRRDHHMFHPTRDSFKQLIEGNGFKIEKEVWQQAYHNVVYLETVRTEALQIG